MDGQPNSSSSPSFRSQSQSQSQPRQADPGLSWGDLSPLKRTQPNDAASYDSTSYNSTSHASTTDRLDMDKDLPPAPAKPTENHQSSRTELPELPEAPPSRVIGQGYSGSHQIPTVQSYKATQAQHEDEARQYSELIEKRQQEAEERERRQDPSTTKQLGHEETNAAKTQKDMKGGQGASQGATEKSRMMDQMNANQREFLCFGICRGGSRELMGWGAQRNPRIRVSGGYVIRSRAGRSSSRTPTPKVRSCMKVGN